MSIKEIIINYMVDKLNYIFSFIPDEFFAEIEEIRIRAEKPIIIIHKGTEYFISNEGQLCNSINDSYIVNSSEIIKIMELISNYSLYAFDEELRNGYLTLPGGHRVGITGKVVQERNFVKTIKNINGLNIRISHEIKGCANKIISYIINRNEVNHTMIISPPACGKTTLLRDIVRQLSDGIYGLINGQAISIADERSEIAGCYMGIPQNDVGIRTDVLDGCPKAEGMIMLLRSMSPKIIAVDEIGKEEDIHAINHIINAGIKLICTVHGSSIDEVIKKPILEDLVAKNIFKRFIVLDKPGSIKGIYNERYENICNQNRRENCDI